MAALLSSVRLGHAEPRIWTPPLRELTPETSLGFEVADFTQNVLGIELLPWQEWLFVHGLELKPDGTYRFRTVLVLVARQNGKTTALMALALWRLVMDAARMILGTSTNLDYARESWEKAVELAWGPPGSKSFAGVPELEGEFRLPRYANGEQTLSTVDGARYKIGTATRRGGRSLSVDLLILDELREHRTWDAWSASSKTTNARPRGQRWALSNMGDDGSVVLNHLQSQALTRLETCVGDDALALFEWSAPAGCDPADRSVWPMANPALGYTITEDTLASDLSTDVESVFRTEVLCQRVPTLEPPPIDLGLWASRAVRRNGPPPGRPVFCIAASPRLTSWAIGAAVYDGAKTFLSLADYGADLDALVARAANLKAHHSGAKFYILATGQASSLVKRLEAVGVRFAKGQALSTTDYGKACGNLLAGVTDGAIEHSGDDLFAIALQGAVARDIGEGLWAFGWRKSTADLTPIEAVTGAAWGARNRSVPTVY